MQELGTAVNRLGYEVLVSKSGSFVYIFQYNLHYIFISGDYRGTPRIIIE
jgi:hypothetical protein